MYITTCYELRHASKAWVFSGDIPPPPSPSPIETTSAVSFIKTHKFDSETQTLCQLLSTVSNLLRGVYFRVFGSKLIKFFLHNSNKMWNCNRTAMNNYVCQREVYRTTSLRQRLTENGASIASKLKKKI